MLFEPHLSPKMKMWQTEAWSELGVRITEHDPQRALFPKRFYEAVERLDHAKIYDFCFIGAFRVDSKTAARRVWLPDFVKGHFSKDSYLQFTDKVTKANYVPLGPFDRTLEREGFVPKEVPVEQRNVFDQHYYQIMCQSRFALCPAGDLRWSMRFYEALMCKAIPILESRWHHRSIREALRPYRVYTPRDEFVYRPDWAEHNYRLFLRHHTLAKIARRLNRQ